MENVFDFFLFLILIPTRLLFLPMYDTSTKVISSVLTVSISTKFLETGYVLSQSIKNERY